MFLLRRLRFVCMCCRFRSFVHIVVVVVAQSLKARARHSSIRRRLSRIFCCVRRFVCIAFLPSPFLRTRSFIYFSPLRAHIKTFVHISIFIFARILHLAILVYVFAPSSICSVCERRACQHVRMCLRCWRVNDYIFFANTCHRARLKITPSM